MKRVLIIGCPGSGKTTLSKQISTQYELPLVHLDHLFWLPEWIEKDQEQFDRELQTILEQDTWVIEGNYGRTMPQRMKYADTVIFLDFNRFICTYRILKRAMFQNSFQAPGCPQKVDWTFFNYVLWKYQSKSRQTVQSLHQEYAHKLNWITLKNPKAVNKWVMNNVTV